MKMVTCALAVVAVLLAVSMMRADAVNLWSRKAGLHMGTSDDAILPGMVDMRGMQSPMDGKRMNEVKIMAGHDKLEMAFSPRPHEYIDMDTLPESFSWTNVDGTSYVTKSLNQHLPQCTYIYPSSSLGDYDCV